MASNTSKRRKLEDISSGICDYSKVPSRCIPPPERPGSLQASSILDEKEPDVPDDSTIPFRFDSLGSRQFRLLRLHAGRVCDPVQCSVFIDNIDGPSSYEAVSYRWGDGAKVKDVFMAHEDTHGLSGSFSQLPVSRRLSSMLAALRRPDRPIILWVDQLCINQDDPLEKSHQVSLIREIYQKAHGVLLWLDAATAYTQDLTTAITNLLQTQRQASYRPSECFCHSQPLIAACDDQYWQRMWVYQEIALAKSITIVCGTQQLAFDDLRLALDLALSTCNDSSHRRGPSRSFERIRSLLSTTERALHRSGDGHVMEATGSLQDLFMKFYSSKCSDPRDRVYALRGLLRPDIRTRIKPDYSKTPIEVYCDATQLMVESSQSLDMTLQPWIPQQESRVALEQHGSTERCHWPSWLAKQELIRSHDGYSVYEQCLMPMNSNAEGNSSSTAIYNASRGSHIAARFTHLIDRRRRRPARSISVSGNVETSATHSHVGTPDQAWQMSNQSNRVLVADGIEIGTVTDISTRMAYGLISRDCLEMAGVDFSCGCESLKTTPCSVWERLWRTIVGDRDAKGKPAPSRYGFAFHTIFREILSRRSLDVSELLERQHTDNVTEFLQRIEGITHNRRLFKSAVNQYDEILLGLAPKGVRLGDKIIILFGCSLPMIVRPSETYGDDYWIIVGSAFVYGKMDGEALSGLDQDTLERQTKVYEIV